MSYRHMYASSLITTLTICNTMTDGRGGKPPQPPKQLWHFDAKKIARLATLASSDIPIFVPKSDSALHIISTIRTYNLHIISAFPVRTIFT